MELGTWLNFVKTLEFRGGDGQPPSPSVCHSYIVYVTSMLMADKTYFGEFRYTEFLLLLQIWL
jgi:hypothetical protein